MKMFILRKETFVRRPLLEVFEFFSRPENLAVITPPWLGFRILTGSPILMKKGTLIEYTVRVFGARVRWQSLISEYEPPLRFIDEQSKGPYKYWRHTHSFSECSGGTVVIDEVHYALPLGALGEIAHAVFVRSQLENIFDYRSRVIQELFASHDAPTRKQLTVADKLEVQL